jgi:hypothetical protein
VAFHYCASFFVLSGKNAGHQQFAAQPKLVGRELMRLSTPSPARSLGLALLSGFSLTFHKELSSSTGFAQREPNNFLPKDAGYEKVHSLQA